jgi:hypothetical protein
VPAVALVTSTGEASWASRAATIEAASAGVLPGPYTTSGPPRRARWWSTAGEPEVLERQGGQAGHGVLGGQLAPGHGAEQLSKPTFIQSPALYNRRRCLPAGLAGGYPRVPAAGREADPPRLPRPGGDPGPRRRRGRPGRPPARVRLTYGRLLAGGDRGEDLLPRWPARSRPPSACAAGSTWSAGRRPSSATRLQPGRHRRPDPLRRLPDAVGQLSYSAAFSTRPGTAWSCRPSTAAPRPAPTPSRSAAAAPTTPLGRGARRHRHGHGRDQPEARFRGPVA